MIRRFYSHYTFIFPDICLKDVVVELDSENHIKLVFPFEKEIENTQFYSGFLIYLPQDISPSTILLNEVKNKEYRPIEKAYSLDLTFECSLYDEDGIKIRL